MINLLRSICSRKQDDWDEQLPTAMGAYNATKSATTGFSPSLLWFGREKRMPHMMLFPHDKYGSVTVDQYAKQLMVNSNKIYAMTRAHTEQAQMRQKRDFDKRVPHQVPYRVDDMVMVHSKIIPRGGTGKLLTAWRGPYKIAKVCQEGRWYILDNSMLTHYDRLKPYVPRITEMDLQEDDVVPNAQRDQAAEKQDVKQVPPEPWDDMEDDSDDTFEPDPLSDSSSDSDDSTAREEVDRRVEDKVLRPRARRDYQRMLNPREFRILSVFKAKQLSQQGQDNKEIAWLERDQDEQTAHLAEVTHEVNMIDVEPADTEFLEGETPQQPSSNPNIQRMFSIQVDPPRALGLRLFGRGAPRTKQPFCEDQ